MAEQAKRDKNFVTAMLFVGSDGGTYNVQGDENTGRIKVDLAGGTGTVTSVSVATANGFAGDVTNPTTTPEITIKTNVTGILKGDGTGVSAATAGTDYVTASSVNTFTNKTYDTAGSGNSFSINGVAVTANTGTGAVVRATSPTLVTPALGVATATSLNGLTITTTTGGVLTIANNKTFSANNSITLAGTDGKTLTVSNSLTLAGTDSTVMTFPNATDTVMGLGAVQTVSGAKTFNSATLIATRPKFITSIDDTNGNEVIVITATGSAVNEVTLANAATGNAPSITASGGDTDINLALNAKGTGKITPLKSVNFGALTAYFTETDNGNSGTSDTVDWTLSNKQKSTLTGNCTFTFTAPPGPCSLVFKLVQDSTGSRTVTWPAAVHWSGGTAPTLTTTANKVDIITFYYDGSTYFGSSVLNFTA